MQKLRGLSIPELVYLHKIYCISIHPLWAEIIGKYWDYAEKFNTPFCQVVSVKNMQEICGKICGFLKKKFGEVGKGSELLGDVLEFYGENVYSDGKGVDKKGFSVGILQVFSRFFSGVSAICFFYVASAVFLCMSMEVKMPHAFLRCLPVVKVSGILG